MSKNSRKQSSKADEIKAYMDSKKTQDKAKLNEEKVDDKKATKKSKKKGLLAKIKEYIMCNDYVKDEHLPSPVVKRIWSGTYINNHLNDRFINEQMYGFDPMSEQMFYDEGYMTGFEHSSHYHSVNEYKAYKYAQSNPRKTKSADKSDDDVIEM